MSASPSEADIQRACCHLLALDGWRILRTDPVSRREWGKGFGEKGMADCLYIRYRLTGEKTVPRSDAEVMWIEWKKLKGNAKPHQLAWIELERGYGALVLLAGLDFPASIEGFRTWYKASGLMMKRILS